MRDTLETTVNMPVYTRKPENKNPAAPAGETRKRVKPTAAFTGQQPGQKLQELVSNSARVQQFKSLRAPGTGPVVQRVKLNDDSAKANGWHNIVDETGDWMAYVKSGKVVILVPKEDFDAADSVPAAKPMVRAGAGGSGPAPAPSYSAPVPRGPAPSGGAQVLAGWKVIEGAPKFNNCTEYAFWGHPDLEAENDLKRLMAAAVTDGYEAVTDPAQATVLLYGRKGHFSHAIKKVGMKWMSFEANDTYEYTGGDAYPKTHRGDGIVGMLKGK